MVKKVFFVSIFVLSIIATTLGTSSPGWAGKSQVKKGLEQSLIYYQGLMRQSRGLVLEKSKLEGGIENVAGDKGYEFYEYEFPNKAACIYFVGTDPTPLGINCTHSSLSKYTESDIKALLGKPGKRRTNIKGMLELRYWRIEGSPYLHSSVTFELKSKKLRKIVFS